jgi:hypothetical protein
MLMFLSAPLAIASSGFLPFTTVNKGGGAGNTAPAVLNFEEESLEGKNGGIHSWLELQP